ncbi:hypothetical protein C7M84_025005 [Penaeus vannamei]|uniref:Uncharacterized protein n=1 Tax=Penaeus vannamei TaxID=6689 RepID=A0A423TZE4_PENVA|nr:hypothetical protein C7M84_025005 [Penaeus vannamei]
MKISPRIGSHSNEDEAVVSENGGGSPPITAFRLLQSNSSHNQQRYTDKSTDADPHGAQASRTSSSTEEMTTNQEGISSSLAQLVQNQTLVATLLSELVAGQKQLVASQKDMLAVARDGSLIRNAPIKRKRTTAEVSSRTTNYLYHVRVNHAEFRVCRIGFLSIYGIGKKKLEILLRKRKDSPNGTPVLDKRGKKPSPRSITGSILASVQEHIQTLPVTSSHYSLTTTPHCGYQEDGTSIGTDYQDTKRNITKARLMNDYARYTRATFNPSNVALAQKYTHDRHQGLRASKADNNSPEEDDPEKDILDNVPLPHPRR